MGRGLFINGPLLGHINPTLGIAHALIEAGETIYYALPSKFSDLVVDIGAHFIPLPEGVYDYFEDWSLEKDKEMLNVEWDLRMVCWTEAILKCIGEKFERGEIDYVVTGHRYGAGFEVAQLLKVPHVCISPNLVPTCPQHTFPADQVLSHEFQSDPHACIDAWKARLRVSNKFKVAVRPFDDLYFNKGDLTIVLTSRNLQPNSETLGDKLIFTGPSMNRPEQNLDFSISESQERIVYVALGSMIQNPEFFKTCISALKDLNALVVMAIGKKVHRGELGEIPRNFIVRNHISQMKILEIADLFISHGGANSLHEGLYHSVPMVLVPHADDAYLNTAAACKEGAAVSLALEELTSSALRGAVDSVLENDSYHQNAKRMGSLLRMAGGTEKAAREILKFTAKPDPQQFMYPSSHPHVASERVLA